MIWGSAKPKDKLQTATVCLMPLALVAIYQGIKPFQDTGSNIRNRISNLSPAQKVNIQLAASKIDGLVLKSGEEFSFNRVVGPRTVERGFVAAPTYLEHNTTMTEGGGVCLVSSMVYQAALESGLTILARSNHSRPTASVLPGLDATVSYPRIDLKLRNDTKEPILFKAKASPERIEIALLGKFDDRAVKLVRRESRSPRSLRVEVLKERSGELVRVSNNQYRLD